MSTDTTTVVRAANGVRLWRYDGDDPNVLHLRQSLFDPNQPNQIVPPRYPIFRDWYKKHQSGDWRAEEIDLSSDKKDWQTLTKDEKHFISMVLGFFATSDTIVACNLVQRFCQDVEDEWCRMYYREQARFEDIHTETYQNLIVNLIKNPAKQRRLFDLVQTDDSIKAKRAWARRWIDDTDATFEQRLLGFACVEGIFFSSSFCAIFWLAKRGMMPGLKMSNELISRDEGIHRDFGCVLQKMLGAPLPQSLVHDMVAQAVKLECAFVEKSLPVKLVGINAEKMGQYVRVVADNMLQKCGYARLYKVRNPFDWMDMINMESKTNMFEGRPTKYRHKNANAWRDKSIGELLDVSSLQQDHSKKD